MEFGGWETGFGYEGREPEIGNLKCPILAIVLSKLTWQYDNIMLIGDFNLTDNKKDLAVFMTTFNLESLISRLRGDTHMTSTLRGDGGGG